MPKYVIEVFQERVYRTKILIKADKKDEAFSTWQEDYSAGTVLDEEVKETGETGEICTMTGKEFLKKFPSAGYKNIIYPRKPVWNMTFDKWFNKYKPIKNKVDEEEILDTLLLPILKKIDKHFVWTCVDGEGSSFVILPGFHFVNRLYYYVTENPWDDIDKDMFVQD